LSRKSQRVVWLAALLGFAAFLGLLIFVAFHADVYARQIKVYSRAVDVTGRLVFSAIGIFLAVCGAGTTFRSVRLVLGGTLTQATVVGHKFEEDCYFPIVEFADHSGRSCHVTSSTGSGNKPYDEGQRVTILYNPAKPQDAVIRAFWRLWLYPLVLTAFAVLFILSGLGIL
jgi:hypothetical protein